ncbi:hypothetical protein V6N13_057026 [Hibiscus sabdariffa]
MLAPNGDWLWFRFEHLLPSPALQRIAAIKAPFRSALPDFLGWLPSSDRSFSVRIAYRLHMGFVDDNVDPYWKGGLAVALWLYSLVDLEASPAGSLSEGQAVHSRSHGHPWVEV